MSARKITYKKFSNKFKKYSVVEFNSITYLIVERKKDRFIAIDLNTLIDVGLCVRHIIDYNTDIGKEFFKVSTIKDNKSILYFICDNKEIISAIEKIRK